jgi:hypothetical protein
MAGPAAIRNYKSIYGSRKFQMNRPRIQSAHHDNYSKRLVGTNYTEYRTRVKSGKKILSRELSSQNQNIVVAEAILRERRGWSPSLSKQLNNNTTIQHSNHQFLLG